MDLLSSSLLSESLLRNARGIRASISRGLRPPAHVQLDPASVTPIREQAAKYKQLSDQQLRETVAQLRASSIGIDEARVPAFALITESVRRCTGKDYYDVQLLGGMQLGDGRIAQMQTGEGKTLTTALPTFLRAVMGQRVHVATTNIYLAERDSEELRAPLEMLGISVGLLTEDPDETLKRKAYRCDVTFGTGFEFGFDFLRDQVALRSRGATPLGQQHLQELMGNLKPRREPVQPCHAFAVVDEADSVLVDEATMPLILAASAGAVPTPEIYRLAQQVAEAMVDGEHYEVDEVKKSIDLTDAGWLRAHEVLADRPPMPLSRHWSVYVQNALRVQLILKRDVDYVVLDGKIQIVDQHTGRIHEDRTWRDGLHQGIETSEGVDITAETSSDARVTRQRYFQLYDGMAGMTGTATGVEEELQSFYGLTTVVIPTHRPSIRQTLPLRCFADNQTRNAAIVDDIMQRYQGDRPVLVGTRTIRHSRELAARLDEIGITHTVLNGLQDESEAAVISQAGRAGAITIATNMAGRGTDIRLDAAVLDAGGLHVIGAEPNLSRRVDRQLAGRAARQGNPGSCRFFVAATDDIFVEAPDLRAAHLGETDEHGETREDLTHVVDKIQNRLEHQDFESRRKMVARDLWLDDILQTLAGQG